MQAKVSLVIPCYNKEQYIDGMMASVYGQTKKNVEVIMVNDGITDGTRERMVLWGERFREKGYAVLLVDQDNRGIAGAVLAGLERITGEYFSVVDCDDYLDPEYLATMANFLDTHHRYDWVNCDYFSYDSCDVSEVRPSFTYRYLHTAPNQLENHISRYVPTAFWTFMVRTEYAKQCRLVERFVVEPRGTQEPPLFLNLAAGQGELYHIPRPLYGWNYAACGEGRTESNEKAAAFLNRYCGQIEAVVQGLPIDKDYKIKLCLLAQLDRMVQTLALFDNEKERLEQAFAFAVVFNRFDVQGQPVTARQILHPHPTIFARALAMWLIGDYKPRLKQLGEKKAGRVIAYAAMGERALRLLPILPSTGMKPDLLWDRNARSNSAAADIPVVPPDFSDLRRGDILLVLSTKQEILRYAAKEAKEVPQEAIFTPYEVEDYLAEWYFPEFFS